MINVKNLVLGIGIIIVFGLLLWQGIEAFYPSPDYDDFCSMGKFIPRIPEKTLPSSDTCIFPRELQEQENNCYNQEGQPIFEYDDNGCIISIKECDLCNKEFNTAQDEHSKVIFIVSIIVGIIALIIGYGILSIEPVGSALMTSGIWAIFWGTAINWRNISSIWRFLLLLLAFVLLVWITLRLNKQKDNKKGFFKNLKKK